jgi:hypothetical protein
LWQMHWLNKTASLRAPSHLLMSDREDYVHYVPNVWDCCVIFTLPLLRTVDAVFDHSRVGH